MEQKAGAQISQRAFVQSLVILFILMILAGVLTLVVPAGQYMRVEVEGRTTIAPDSFQYTTAPDYPVWRWFTAPIKVLGSDYGLTVIVIIVVLLFAGGAFAVMDKTGAISAFIGRVVGRFREHKYALLWMVSLAFMLLGATIGAFKEVVLLVPVMVALAYSGAADQPGPDGGQLPQVDPLDGQAVAVGRPGYGHLPGCRRGCRLRPVLITARRSAA